MNKSLFILLLVFLFIECRNKKIKLTDDDTVVITDFIDRELVGDVRLRTVTIAVPADEPPLLRVRGAEAAFAIAEAFRDAGQHVLLILDSLSRVVHGARDVAMARGEAVGPRGYPASALGLIARLVERAGGDRRSGGAITAICTVLAEAGEGDSGGSDPVVDAARGVLDGHILLSRRLAGRGQFPAIDLAASTSRVMADICAPDQIAAAARFRRLSALVEDNRDLVLMGAYAPGNDAELDAALALGPALEAFRAQPRGQRIASFFWIQSMIRDDGQRTLLFDLDSAIQQVARDLTDHPASVQLTGVYHNLLRKWAEV